MCPRNIHLRGHIARNLSFRLAWLRRTHVLSIIHATRQDNHYWYQLVCMPGKLVRQMGISYDSLDNGSYRYHLLSFLVVHTYSHTCFGLRYPPSQRSRAQRGLRYIWRHLDTLGLGLPAYLCIPHCFSSHDVRLGLPGQQLRVLTAIECKRNTSQSWWIKNAKYAATTTNGTGSICLASSGCASPARYGPCLSIARLTSNAVGSHASRIANDGAIAASYRLANNSLMREIDILMTSDISHTILTVTRNRQ